MVIAINVHMEKAIYKVFGIFSVTPDKTVLSARYSIRDYSWKESFFRMIYASRKLQQLSFPHPKLLLHFPLEQREFLQRYFHKMLVVIGLERSNEIIRGVVKQFHASFGVISFVKDYRDFIYVNWALFQSAQLLPRSDIPGGRKKPGSWVFPAESSKWKANICSIFRYRRKIKYLGATEK